jgi:hypothetical protein
LGIGSQRHHEVNVGCTLIIKIFGRKIWPHGYCKLGKFFIQLLVAVPGTQPTALLSEFIMGNKIVSIDIEVSSAKATAVVYRLMNGEG